MKKFNFLFLLFAIQTLLFSQNNLNTPNRDWDPTTFVNNQEINLYPFIYTDILQATVSGEDLGISEITTNYSSTFCYLGVPINCFIKVNNYGTTPASNFSITLSDVNGFSHTDTIYTTLNSGQYTYYPIAWTPSATGNKTITALVTNSGDLVSTNNTKTATLSVYQYQVTAAPTPSVRSIAEFEPQRGAFVRATVSGSSVTFGVPIQLLTEIAENDTLYVVCSNQTAANTIQTYLTNNSIDGSRIKYVLAPTNSHWTRDFGPWFIENNERNLEIIDFPYNRPRANDSQVPRAFGTTTGTTVYGMPLLHTGGNYMADGLGVAASCDLVQYENNCYSNTELDEIYLNYLGVSTYHQIPDPLNSYIQHIDCWGKFLAPDKILILQVPSSNANYTDLENAAQYFANQTSSFGNKYKVYRVYTPNNQPYTNSLILNNKVLVPMNPTYGSSCYQNALAAYQQAMPGYEIIGVPYNDWYDTDALHCRAIQIPQADMLRLVHYPLLDSVAYQNTISITANAYTLGNNTGVSENLNSALQD
jgi:agmatine/peptidylarginine deiminase